MSEHVPQENRPFKWIFPVVFLALIAIAALYIVRDNFNERQPVNQTVNKDTRSDKMDSIPVLGTETDSTYRVKPDSLNRERGSQPEVDTIRKPL